MGSENKTRELMQSALREISSLKKELSALRKTRNEPIAVVGMSCRYPGGINDAESYWQALVEGKDCIDYDGAGRWDMDALFDENPEAPGKIYTKALGAIDRPEYFDAEFFGISPREAEATDPQHRILLEVCHDAMEHAGIASDRLAGSKSGVFVGISSTDYAQLGTLFGSAEALSPWHGTGNALSAAAGRISYLYDFKGPCISVDTACSSSLVAMHYACQSLRQGDCDMALAGGVHLVLNPATTIIFSKARMLAPDGKCKTFSADADGYVRSEGCGVVVLKRLSDAVANGDSILATIRGSAVNQDGKSQGLTAPNEAAQEAVIKAALSQAKLEAAQVSYVEAHGTGTALGDPIELNALHHVYQEDRGKDKPLFLGSVKTNFGHSEAASGVAGVIKTILSLRGKKLPKHLHFSQPNPYVDWSGMNFEILSEGRQWQTESASDGIRRGAVSAFGFTGTNAHMILEEHVSSKGSTEGKSQQSRTKILTLSAKKQESLSLLKANLAEFIRTHSDYALDDIISSQNLGRNQYKFREALYVSDKESLIQQLEENQQQLAGKKKRPALKIGLIVDLQINDWIETVESLLESSAVFNSHLQQVLDLVARSAPDRSDFSKDSIRETWKTALSRNKEHSLKSKRRDLWADFAAQYALTKSIIEWSVKPNLVLGHGLGAYVMAVVAGILKVEDVLMILLKEGTGTVRDKDPGIKNPRIPYIKGEDGERLSAAEKSLVYWQERLNQKENYEKSLTAVQDYGADVTLLVGSATERTNENLVNIDPKDLTSLELGLGQAFCQGLDLDWGKIYAGQAHKKVSLPTYPYLRKRHWSRELDLAQQIKVLSDRTKVGENQLYKVSWQAVEPSNHKKAFNDDLLDSGIDSNNSLGAWSLLNINSNKQSVPCSVGHQLDISFKGSDRVLQVDGKSIPLTYAGFPLLQSALSSFLDQCVAGARSLHVVSNEAATKLSPLLISLAGISEEEDPNYLTLLMLALAKALQKSRALKAYFITENGLYVPDQTETLQSNQSLLAGFIKNLMLELPDKVYGHVDRDSDTDSNPSSMSPGFESLINSVDSMDRFQPVAVRAGEWLECQLLRDDLQREAEQQPLTIKSDVPYLIVGGTGSLGIQIASTLITLGARNIWLMSRGGEVSTETKAVVNEWERLGVSTQIFKLDIANKKSFQQWISELSQDPTRRPAGIIHAAGVYDITPISDLTLDRCQQVMASKVQGVKNLDEAFPINSLDFFIGFSSIASVWGSAGNFHYCAANHYVDGILQKRGQQGELTKLFNWGPWAESNMVNQDTAALAEQRGLLQLDKAEGMALFSKLLLETSSQHVIANIDWQKLKRVMDLTAMGSMFRNMDMDAPLSGQSESSNIEVSVKLTEADLAFSQALADAEESEKTELLLGYLTEQLALALQLEVDDIDEYCPLISLGIDSLMALEFRDRLRKVSSIEVPFVKLMEGASLVDISQLVTELDDEPAESPLEMVVEGAL